MTGVLAAVAWFGAIALTGLAGPMAPTVRQLLALTALLLLAALGLPEATRSTRRWRGLVFVALAAAVVLLPSSLARGIGYAGAVAAVAPPALAGLAPGLFLAALATAVWSWLPGAAPFAESCATLLGNAFLAADGEELKLGPSALALPAAAWAAVLLLVRAAHGRRWLPVAGVALLLPACLTAPALADAWQNRWGPHAGHGHEVGVFAFHSATMLLLALTLACTWWPAARSADLEPQDRRRARTMLWATGSLVLGALGAVLFSGWRSETAPDRRVAILNVGVDGSMDWDRPTFERLGAFSGGMFGLLPIHLERAGWEVEALPESELPELSLARARVLLLINCPRPWSDEERVRLEAFVSEGGSVLVLGDHTDVFGLMEAFNGLLDPWGIRFRFDSAYHSGRGWSDDIEWIPGLTGYAQDAPSAGVAIGASLEVRPPARPLIQARYAFSDWGVRENLMGSFLGNYQYEPGEQLGDLALVAGRRIGKGKVVVFGDTSGYQNAALASYFPRHVEPFLSALAQPSGFALPWGAEVALAVLLLAWAVFVCSTARRELRVATVALGLPLCAGALLVPVYDAEQVLARTDLADFLLVDEFHHPNTGHYEAGWNPIGPLNTCAQRSGLLVYQTRHWDADAVRRARGIALVGPQRPLGEVAVDDLVAAMQSGSTVWLAASGTDRRGALPLLRRFGIDLHPSSLGNVPPAGEQDEMEPRFVNPSPLLVPPSVPVRELYRRGGDLLAAAVPVGEGWLIVIADTRFFSMGNVEGMWGWWGGNLRFLHDLFQEFSDGAAIEVAPVLQAPSPPEGQ